MPLFRLLIPFITGILIEIFCPFQIEILLWILPVFLFIISLFTFIKKIYRKVSIRWIYGAALNFCVFILGVLLTWLHTEKNESSHFSYSFPAKEYIGVLADQLHEKKNSYKTIVELKSIRLKDGDWKNVTGKVLIYLAMDTASAKLKYGDVIMFAALPKEVDPPKNPEQFNYKRFLSFHNVYHQVYLAGNKWKSLNYNEGNALRKFSFDLRDRLVDIFKTRIIREQEYGVASALVLGYEDNIDAELINAYSNAGALHVLSVSGMHVGIIFLVFSWMLSWMDKSKWLRHLKFIVLLLFIWFYAMLTGFSPAVLRSAMMITVVIIGSWSKSSSNIFNTLIVSVFALLLYNPYYITEVGFQLSYLAVFGICYLHPMIAKWFEPSNWLVYSIWQITSVSISAQLMTFPLGLLYFHQFPNLFFISNIVVIPLSTVIIYISILLLFTSWIPVFSTYLAVTCFGLLYALNNSVLFVEKIPFSIVPDISISVFETWIIYLLMALFIFFLVYKRPIFLISGLSLVIVLCTGQLLESISINSQKKFIVYDIPKQTAIELVASTENIFIAPRDLINDKSRMMFNILHNRWLLGLNQTTNIDSSKISLKNDKYIVKNNFVQFFNKKVLILKNKFIVQNKKTVKEKLKLDYLILSGNNYQKLEDIINYFDFKLLIIDSSNSLWRAEKVIKKCREQHINYFSVPHNGAYVADI